MRAFEVEGIQAQPCIRMIPPQTDRRVRCVALQVPRENSSETAKPPEHDCTSSELGRMIACSHLKVEINSQHNLQTRLRILVAKMRYGSACVFASPPEQNGLVPNRPQQRLACYIIVQHTII